MDMIKEMKGFSVEELKKLRFLDPKQENLRKQLLDLHQNIHKLEVLLRAYKKKHLKPRKETE